MTSSTTRSESTGLLVAEVAGDGDGFGGDGTGTKTGGSETERSLEEVGHDIQRDKMQPFVVPKGECGYVQLS